RHPQAQRYGDGHFFEDKIYDRDVAIVALSEVKAQVIAKHGKEALQRRLVEAELFFDALDQLGRQALAAAIASAAALGLTLAWLAREVSALAAGDALGNARILAGQVGERLFHRATGGKLSDEKT